MATSGEASNAAMLTKMAVPATTAADLRVKWTSGEDSSTTAKSESADIVQSDVGRTCMTIANGIAASGGTQNMTAAKRRSRSRGNRISITALREGFARSATASSGPA